MKKITESQKIQVEFKDHENNLQGNHLILFYV